jgi:hypothetical protein
VEAGAAPKVPALNVCGACGGGFVVDVDAPVGAGEGGV